LVGGGGTPFSQVAQHHKGGEELRKGKIPALFRKKRWIGGVRPPERKKTATRKEEGEKTSEGKDKGKGKKETTWVGGFCFFWKKRGGVLVFGGSMSKLKGGQLGGKGNEKIWGTLTGKKSKAANRKGETDEDKAPPPRKNNLGIFGSSEK